MLKKTITYRDFNGVEVSEDFYFNINQAECIDLDFDYENVGGIREYLKSLIVAINKDGDAAPKKPLYDIIKKIIAVAIGKKSADGKRFIKNSEISDAFFQSNAFSNFVIDLFHSEDGFSEFVTAVFPEVSEEDRAKAKAELEKEGIVLQG